jgi:nitrogen fixation/metabolism regulation signal transduction histidine kinase
MLAPLANFKNTFPWIILITLWVVLFLSINQIRKSMIPLEKLKEGTQRIAQGDFDSQVEVHSQDEFADLANSFNTMASHLGRQFKTLTAMVDIDRAILSALEIKKIVTRRLKYSIIIPIIYSYQRKKAFLSTWLR